MTGRIRVAHVATIDLTVRVLLMAQLRRLRDAGFDVTTISAPGPWAKEMRAEGMQHVPWHHATRAVSPLADVRAFGELVAILRRGRFHLVHTHNAKPGVMGRIAARLTGVPCVVNTVHGFDARPDDALSKRVAFMGLEWIAARFSDLELYQSEADRRRARRLMMSKASRTRLLGNGVDLRKFDPEVVDRRHVEVLRRALGIPEGSIVIGTVGRLVADKGYREFFQAVRSIRASMPDVQVFAIGDRDPQKPDALTELDIAGAAQDVHFLGWREDMPDLYALMDIFVLASWREGLPRAAMEAAAMGKALVLTDIPGCREVARDGTEGVLIPPRDDRALASAMERLAVDQRLREKMGAAARRRALERFDEQEVAERLLRWYRTLIRSKRLEGESASDSRAGKLRLRRRSLIASRADGPQSRVAGDGRENVSFRTKPCATAQGEVT
jgi:glycosyltransferase involved in cell wall biosynthesis